MNGRGRIAAVAQLKYKVPSAQPVDHIEEQIILKPCVNLCLPLLVRTGEVGKNPLWVQPRQRACFLDFVDRSRILHIVPVREADPGHPGIHFDVDAHLQACLFRAGGQLMGIANVENCLGNPVERQLLCIFRWRVAENQNGLIKPRAAHLNGLLQIGHGKPVHAGLTHLAR